MDGFTIVELLVVIVVIAILAAISIVVYVSIQEKAQDARMRVVATDVGKVLTEKSIDGPLPIVSSGFFHTTGSGVVSVDTLVQDRMPNNYRDGIKSKNVNVSTGSFKIQKCTLVDGFAIYVSLNQPSDDDQTNFTSVWQQCRNQNPSSAGNPGYQYNYARLFSE